MAVTTTKCLWQEVNVTPKTTEQHLSVRSDKSVVYVTSNKRLRSTFVLLKLKLTADRHGLFATAELLVESPCNLRHSSRFLCRPLYCVSFFMTSTTVRPYIGLSRREGQSVDVDESLSIMIIVLTFMQWVYYCQGFFFSCWHIVAKMSFANAQPNNFQLPSLFMVSFVSSIGACRWRCCSCECPPSCSVLSSPLSSFVCVRSSLESKPVTVRSIFLNS